MKPDYECVRQCLTFRGESLPDVLRRVAEYIEQHPIICPDFVFSQDGEDGEYCITVYGEWRHVKFEVIAFKEPESHKCDHA